MPFRPLSAAAAALLLAAATLPAEEAAAPGPPPPPDPRAAAGAGIPIPATDGDLIRRLEGLAEEGRLPTYDDLRFEGVDERELRELYLQNLPPTISPAAIEDILFPDIPADSPFQALGLPELVALAMDGNFELMNSRRDVRIARSETTASEAFFLPFVDLVGSARRTVNTTPDAFIPGTGGEDFDPRTGRERARTDRATAGIEARQNLPTGGAFTGSVTEGANRTKTEIGDFTARSNDYDARAEVRYLQPLLRGSSLPGIAGGDGTLIGTADQRRANLSEMNQILSDNLRQRDVAQRVIRQYFQLLQIRQQLMVSRDAVRERWRFLIETRIRQEAGRVAESEILRAEIQFLQEVERAISRQQALDNARDSLLTLLSLPLDTPVSLVDVTTALIERGRFELPPLGEALAVAAGSRLELMQSDITIELARISEALARNDLLPQLDFDAGIGRSDRGDSLRDANQLDNETWDAGVTLRIPLQQVARREGYRQARLRSEQRLTSRQSLELSISQEVSSAYRSLLTTEARLTVLAKQVEQARRNLELINESFVEGFSTITEVRLAQDDLFGAETAYSNAVLDYQISISDLYVSMGLPLN